MLRSKAPYPNNHVCHRKEAKLFKSIRSWKGRIAKKPVTFRGGRLKSNDKLEVQSVLFPKSSWTASEARKHCSGRFTPAK